MEKNCSNCHYGQIEYNPNNDLLFRTHPNRKAYTNADAIRSMTDAQLAHFLAKNYGGAVGGYLKWLKEEKKE